MIPLQFTLSDFQSPERLERLFRRLNQVLAEPSTAPPALDLQALAASLAPLIRSDLQAPGVAPLNLQSLLPATGLGIVLEDTHANRLALYPAANTAVGTLFWETNRTVLYVVTESGGTRSWSYAAGLYRSTFANRPTDLGTADANFELFITTGTAGVIYLHKFTWNGASWNFEGDPSGVFVESTVSLAAYGYQLCDGTATTYLAPSGADLAEIAFTPSDENTAPAGVYHKSIAAYTGVINAAVAPGTSGSTAATTATNIAAATGVTIDNESAHTHAVTSPTGTPSATVAVQSGAGTTVATDTHTHTVTSPTGAGSAHNHGATDPTHNHTQNSHTHGIGTIVVDSTAQPRNMGVLRYFRR